VQDFISAFRTTDWTQFGHGDDWPHSSDGCLVGLVLDASPPESEQWQLLKPIPNRN
jgi:hypothetical protein